MAGLFFLLLVALGQAVPSSPPRDTRPASELPASIAGRISEKGSGRPLPGALVILSGLDGSQKQRAIADASGQYELAVIEPGEYVLWASAGDHRSTHLPQAFGQSEPMDPWARSRSGLELHAGERRTEMNIALARALAIEGRLTDPWDEAMANVDVELKRVDGAPAAAPPRRSNDRGEFRLYGLRPGRYHVCAVPQGGFTRSTDSGRFVRTCYPASTSESSRSDIVLTTSDVTGIDIRVQRSETFSISGTVQDAAGVLVDGGWVAASSLDRQEISSSARTQNGEFKVAGLPRGRYIVYASIGGPANPSDTRPPARQRETGFTEVDLAGADAAGLTIGLSKGRSVHGRIVLEDTSTPPFKPQQLGVQAAAPATGRRFSLEPSSSSVDDKLTFELSEIFHFPVTVYLGGLPDGWLVKSIKYGDRDITDIPTDLASRSDDTRLEILVTNRVIMPTVRVLDARGAPAASYEVVALPAHAARWKQAGLRGQVRGSVPKDGVIKIGPLVPGDYLVAAIARDDYLALLTEPTRVDQLAPLAIRVTFTERENRPLELHMTALPAR
jgi:hypothetical protein